MTDRPAIPETTLAQVTDEARRFNLLKPIVVGSLFAAITNYVPVSAAASGLALLLWPFALTRSNLPRPIVPLVALLAYTIVHIVLYQFELFVQFEFFRRDGNFFITMAPLMFFGCLAIAFDVEKTLRRFIYFTTAVNVVVFSFWFFADLALFRAFTGEGSRTTDYHFMFVAHNAGGGFLAVLSAFSLALYVSQRSTIALLIFLFNAFTLVMSVSRGSMIGLVLAALFVFVFAFAQRKPMHVLVTILVLNIGFVLYIYARTDIESVIYSRLFVTNLLGNLSPALQSVLDGNISNRIESLWPLAMHAFFKSPIFGIGFSAYNDFPWQYWGIEGLVAFNVPYQAVNNDAHAHHTYLHVMAETGMVGLVLLLWFFKRIFDYIRGIESDFLRNALLLAFWVCTLSSLTEHRFFTPSQMLPFILVLTMAMARDNFIERARRPRITPIAERLRPSLSDVPTGPAGEPRR